mmetsp:Transcript_16518/g.19531  ORF Transcript_16518/g.19531 Transcript_16518/m.19531 type:complete len:164 (-) Transcript_16518:160-651(-)
MVFPDKLVVAESISHSIVSIPKGLRSPPDKPPDIQSGHRTTTTGTTTIESQLEDARTKILDFREKKAAAAALTSHHVSALYSSPSTSDNHNGWVSTNGSFDQMSEVSVNGSFEVQTHSIHVPLSDDRGDGKNHGLPLERKLSEHSQGSSRSRSRSKSCRVSRD